MRGREAFVRRGPSKMNRLSEPLKIAKKREIVKDVRGMEARWLQFRRRRHAARKAE